MPKNMRASQFMPFDGWEGFRQIIAEKERIFVERKEVMEDTLEELDHKFQMIQPGKVITVVCYDHDDYIKVEGMVSKIDIITRSMTIVDYKVYFKDIISLELND